MDINISLMTAQALNGSTELYNKKELYEAVQFYCRSSGTSAGLIYIYVGIAISFIEYFVFSYAIKNHSKMIIDKTFNKYFCIKFSWFDFASQIAVYKYIMYAVGIIYIIMGAGIYA